MSTTYYYFRKLTDGGNSRPGERRDQHQVDRIVGLLQRLTIHELGPIFEAFTGEKKLPQPKDRLCAILASLLDFQTPEEFLPLWSALPAYLRDAVTLGTFEEWFDPKPIETAHGIVIVAKEKSYGYRQKYRVTPGIRLGFFVVHPDRPLLAMPGWLRELFLPFMPKPQAWTLAPLEKKPGSTWSNEAGIIDGLPLLLRALDLGNGTRDSWDLSKKGFNKTEIARLRSTSGIPPFGQAAALGLDSVELLARFLACFAGPGVRKKFAIQGGSTLEGLRSLATLFFSEQAGKGNTNEELRSGRWLETAVLNDHLSRKPGTQTNFFGEAPPSRRELRLSLNALAELDDWVDARGLFDWFWVHLCSMRCFDDEDEGWSLHLRGSRLDLSPPLDQESEWNAQLAVNGPWRKELLARPLFEAYCYLLAVLGFVEIAEGEAPRRLLKKGQLLPISPADALVALRLTKLGRWCLGYDADPPALETAHYEAIADPELLVVAFRGKHLELRLYLDAIGTPLGEERWRITEAKFITGCDSIAAIEKRIEDFRRLVDRAPSPRWERFFALVLERAAALPSRRAAWIVPLPKDSATREALRADPKFRALALRVEDGSVVVRAEDYAAFAKLLAAYGFWAPTEKRGRTALR